MTLGRLGVALSVHSTFHSPRLAQEHTESKPLSRCMLPRRIVSSPLVTSLSRRSLASSSPTRPSSTMASLPQVKPYSGGQAKIRNVANMQEGKWIELRKIDWTDEDGKGALPSS